MIEHFQECLPYGRYVPDVRRRCVGNTAAASCLSLIVAMANGKLLASERCAHGSG
jgi:hypothetical protein